MPSNMFASVVLGYIAEYANSKYQDETMAKEAYMLKKQIEQGIEADAVRNLDGIGETYVYETDGYGNDVWMDDANVPNLCQCHGLVGVVWMMHGIRILENGF